jgi:Tol biopolymer transport system component
LTDNPRLYWLRLDASGKMSSLSRVSGFHSTQHLLAMAVSPDGTRVAYALPNVVKPDSNGDSQCGIAVLNLATRHTQTFSSNGDIRNLSWADDGRHLGDLIVIEGETYLGKPRGGYHWNDLREKQPDPSTA